MFLALVVFSPWMLGKTFPGCHLPHWRESTWIGNLLWSHLSNKEGLEGGLSVIVYLYLRIVTRAKIYSELKELNKCFGKTQCRNKHEATK